MGATANFKILNEDERYTLLGDTDAIETFLFGEDCDFPRNVFDLDKAWHTIHYLLTGCLETDGSVLGDAILGGRELGPNLGYGAARLLDPQRVKEIDAALRTVDLKSRIEAARPDELLLKKLFFVRELKRDATYLIFKFERLKDCYEQAAKTSSSVLAFLA